MKKRNTLTLILTMALVLVAMTAIGAHATAEKTFNSHSNFQFLVAYVPGQTLRFSVFNPNTPEQGSEGVSARAYIYDATGRLLAQSPETAIAAGQFHSFDFNRDAISAEGEPGTRRLQVRGTIQILLGDGSARSVSPSFPISLEGIDTSSNVIRNSAIALYGISIEGIDNASGKTTGSYYTGTVTVSDD